MASEAQMTRWTRPASSSSCGCFAEPRLKWARGLSGGHRNTRGDNVLEPLRHLASWTNDTYDMYMLHVHVDSRAHVHVHVHAPVVCVSSDGSCYVLELANSLL